MPDELAPVDAPVDVAGAAELVEGADEVDEDEEEPPPQPAKASATTASSPPIHRRLDLDVVVLLIQDLRGHMFLHG